MGKTSKTLATLATGILASFAPIKKAEAQVDASGWLEASFGRPTANLRLYPRLNAGNGIVNLQSLIDINNYYRFSKTDVHSDKVALNFGSFSLRPYATLFTNPDGARLRAGSNLSYSFPGKAFGFVELDFDAEGLGESAFYTYTGAILPKSLGTIGFFTSSKLNDLKSTYAELEATGPRITEGVSPYVRVNLQKGEDTTWQVGISLDPRDAF